MSRQLADWLLKRAFRMHGNVMLLTDLYCMFNRARGTGSLFMTRLHNILFLLILNRFVEMISPEDLYRACLMFEQLQLPVRMKKV